MKKKFFIENLFHTINNAINLNYDGIIGSDFIQHFKIDIHYSNNTLNLENYKIPISLSRPKYVIPPRSETVIECPVSNLSEIINLKEGLILDHEIRDGVFLANCIVSLKPNNRVNVSILNTTYEEYFKKQFTKTSSVCDTKIVEHNESLHKAKQKCIACPVSLDLDNSMPHTEQLLAMLDNSQEFRAGEREPDTSQTVVCNINKILYFLYTKVHHFDETTYKTIYNYYLNYVMILFLKMIMKRS
ncbi:hypothetical protein PYW08_012340 [Mythimna loreyi]|uniref:Uncharacterized protein n=1 Tax=Mythimna loreyi TaxID=667449 RepID=A0ACC2Q1T2_9NEOP|nr:hypothetical protein PYW08_012340 [Mythimna loreyi]